MPPPPPHLSQLTSSKINDLFLNIFVICISKNTKVFLSVAKIRHQIQRRGWLTNRFNWTLTSPILANIHWYSEREEAWTCKESRLTRLSIRAKRGRSFQKGLWHTFSKFVFICNKIQTVTSVEANIINIFLWVSDKNHGNKKVSH